MTDTAPTTMNRTLRRLANSAYRPREFGRVPLRQPRRAVTKFQVTKSAGRPPIGEKAMTDAEGMRKLRVNRRALTRTSRAFWATGALSKTPVFRNHLDILIYFFDSGDRRQ
jgi:hypothetical protein